MEKAGTSAKSAAADARPTMSQSLPTNSRTGKKLPGVVDQEELSSQAELFTKYKLGDEVLAIHRGFWHCANVIDLDKSEHPQNKTLIVPIVKIHYPGFNKKYDEWLMGDSMMLHTPENETRANEENLKLQEEIQNERAGQRLTKRGVKKEGEISSAQKVAPQSSDTTEKPGGRGRGPTKKEAKKTAGREKRFSGDEKSPASTGSDSTKQIAAKFDPALIGAAEKLRLSCSRYLMSKFTTESISDVLDITQELVETANELKQTAVTFIHKNSEAIFASKQWKAYEKRKPDVALELLHQVGSEVGAGAGAGPSAPKKSRRQ